MNNISGKINLLMLNGAVKKMKAKSGEIECLIIPIELNHLFKGEKGIYLDIIGFELANKKEGSKDTHLVKQSLSKDVRDLMSDDELKAMPIIGNLSVWGDSISQQEPVTNPNPIEETDDLPF
jgi:hypothetical protein